MKNLMISMALLVCSYFVGAEDDYMYFLVDKINLTRGGVNDYRILNGETIAKRIYVMMDNNEFEIDSANGESISAITYLTDKRLYFLKDEIKFSTPLDVTNVLYSLTSLSATNAEIELAKKGIRVQGEYLEAELDKNLFLIRNLNMFCLTTDFTTDVDIACLTDTTITPYERDSGYLKIEDLSAKKEYRIEMNTSELSIKNDHLNFDATKMWGTYKDSRFSFVNGSLDCKKDPTLNELDVERFVNGCLELTSFKGGLLNWKQAALDVEVDGLTLKIDSGSFNIKSDTVRFKTNEGVTEVQRFNYLCEKLDVDTDNSNTYILLNGCLKGSHLSMYRFNSNSKSPKRSLSTGKGIIDINDLKNIDMAVRDGNFSLTAKVKVIARLKVLIKGNIELNELQEKLTIAIDKARIAGLPARSFAMFIIRNFIDEEVIEIDGNKIIVTLASGK